MMKRILSRSLSLEQLERRVVLSVTFVDSGQEFGGKDAESRLDFAMRHAVSRPPDAFEAKLLLLTEAFDVWGEEKTLKRLVRVLRETRPHVVITNHAPEGGPTHFRDRLPGRARRRRDDGHDLARLREHHRRHLHGDPHPRPHGRRCRRSPGRSR